MTKTREVESLVLNIILEIKLKKGQVIFMDKLTAIKIKYDDGTYSDEIPVSVLSENVEWDSTHTLVDVLGSIDVDVTGTIQDQISRLFNEKVSATQLQNYVASQLNEDVSSWLNTNVNPVGSAVVVDSSLTISGAAADAKITGDNISNLNSVLNNIVPVKDYETDFFDNVNYGIPENVQYTHSWGDGNGVYHAGDSTTNSLIFPVEPNTKYYIYIPLKNRAYAVESENSFHVGSTYSVSNLEQISSDGYSVIKLTTSTTAKCVSLYFYFGSYDYDANKNDIKIYKNNFYRINIQPTIKEELISKKQLHVIPKNTVFFDNVNYFDPEFATVYNDRFVSANGYISGQSNVSTIVFAVEPNTVYWFYAPGMNRTYVCEGEDSYFSISNTYTLLHTGVDSSVYSFTTGASAKYVAIYFYSGIYDYNTNKNSIILNKNNYTQTEKPIIKDEYLPTIFPIAPNKTTFFKGINYFTPSETTVRTDIFVDADGYIRSQPNDGTTLIFEVEPNTVYWFYAPDMNRRFVAGNSNSTFVIGTQYTSLYASSGSSAYSFTTGSNIHYVAIYLYNGADYDYETNVDGIVLNKDTYSSQEYIDKKYLPTDYGNPINNAQILIFGDSITDCCHLTINSDKETTAYTWANPSNSYVNEDNVRINYSMWAKILKESEPCGEIRNYALQGASYRTRSRETGYERQNIQYQIDVALNDRDNPNNVFSVANYVPDIVIFALGTNDGAPNDSYESAMNATVYDGNTINVEATISALDDTKTIASARKAYMRIKQAFPMAQIYTVLPIQRAGDDSAISSLHEELKKIGQRYGCIIIDGAFDCGITRDFNVNGGLGLYLKDGLHPNEKGQNLMARMIIASLKLHYLPFKTGFNTIN